MPKCAICQFCELFGKPEACGQTALPDMSAPKNNTYLVENAKIQRGTYELNSLKMPKNVFFDEFSKTWSLRSNSVTRHVMSVFIGLKLVENVKMSKIQIRQICKSSANFKF